MVTQVEFLLLESSSQWTVCALDSLTKLYQQYERVLVLASQRKHLEQLDELLWHRSSEHFVAYSMDDQCYAGSSSVLLTDVEPLRLRFNALLNLSDKATANPEQFRSITEIVQVAEQSKDLARERYKLYRHLGFNISHRTIIPVPPIIIW
ncbi:MAG: hypothetical protein COA74_11555 [Gammaproteobacteria bacterium]|nr:MAG: hypothetical protein COA74_11555 [Gammaproteobacteria bacterium]